MIDNALPSALDYPLGTLGLTLVLAVTRLVDLESRSTTGLSGWAGRTVARTGLTGVSVIGALVDGVAGQGRAAHVPAQMPYAGR